MFELRLYASKDGQRVIAVRDESYFFKDAYNVFVILPWGGLMCSVPMTERQIRKQYPLRVTHCEVDE